MAAYNSILRAEGATFANNSAALGSSGSNSVDFLGSQPAGGCGALLLWSCSSAYMADGVMAGNSAAADGGAVCLNNTNLGVASTKVDNNQVCCLLRWEAAAVQRVHCHARPAAGRGDHAPPHAAEITHRHMPVLLCVCTPAVLPRA